MTIAAGADWYELLLPPREVAPCVADCGMLVERGPQTRRRLYCSPACRDRRTAALASARSTAKRRSRTRARGKTLAARRLTREERALSETLETPDVDRPASRGDCAAGARPCPFVSCKHHLYLDVSDIGTIKLNWPDLEVWELRETCALDVADRGGATLEEAGELMNLTRERVRQVEVRALIRLKRQVEE